MTTHSNPIPAGFHTLSAYLWVRGASAALEFYKNAFGATELMRLNTPDGKIAHAQFKIGDSIFMISDENPECGSTSPEALGGSAVTLHLYVTDADATLSDALKAGATATMPLGNQFWGDRMGGLVDPFGHQWMVATHIEDVAPEQLQSRMAACFAQHSA